MVVLSDYFSDDSLAFAKWRVGSLTAGSASTDQQIEVIQSDGRLQIKPREDVTGRSYNGVITKDVWNMIGAHARVELLQSTFGTANTIFAVGIDSDNWYGFVVESGKLFMQSKVSGRKNSMSIPYSFSQHRFWRLRHEASASQMLWETSPDGQSWIVRRSMAPEFSITEVQIYLGAGTYVRETFPGFAVFDNFRFVVHSSQ